MFIQGIDAVWKGKENGGVQYDFVVEPNANPNQVEWEIDGAESVEIDEKGDLLIKTEFGEIRQQKPFTYQEATNGLKQEVESRFVIKETKSAIRNPQSAIVKFEVGNYDRTKTLTIDPSVNLSNLAFSTLLGGERSDEGYGIAVDRAGNIYVTGYAFSISFPTTSGTFDTTHNGNQDVFVSKLNASGTELIFSTFLGGSSNDEGRGIAIDTSGNVFITGFTIDGTTDYPTTSGAFDTTHNGGGSDVFVTKLNPTGSALVYSTFIGGSSTDVGYGIAIDTSGNAFITGSTADGETDYPTTSGAFDTTQNGNKDVFVTKLNPTGSNLDYSTFIGGSPNDFGIGIAIDTSGNVFITGYTSDSTTDYPTTSGAFDTTPNGSLDTFVSKFGDFSISGRTLHYDGMAIPNVRIALSGASSGFVLTDAEGYFNFSDTAAGNFAVSATRPLYAFNPATFQFPSLSTNQRLTFVGQPVSGGPTAAFAALGGKVQSTAGNVGLPNTRLTLIDTINGDVNVVTTDANGDYEFDAVVTGAFYLVVAEREGYNFAPQHL